MNKNKNVRNFFERLLADEFRDLYGVVIFSAIISTGIYGHFFADHSLEDYDLNKKLHVPQKEVVMRDRGVAYTIKREKEFTADFNRMYNELKGWEKITWLSQPLDSAAVYPAANYSFHEEPKPITMHQYRDYILEYRNKLYCHACQLAKTKYKNYTGREK
jgi:hypothetical protein